MPLEKALSIIEVLFNYNAKAYSRLAYSRQVSIANRKMACFRLKSLSGSRLVYLRDYHTFGRRSDTVDTAIDSKCISKLHAIIEWRKPKWLIKDVSKNGVKLNSRVMPAQKFIALNVGDKIDFAGESEFTLSILDLDAPTSMLINQASPTKTIEITQSILLPNEETPELALYRCHDHKQWFTEPIQQDREPLFHRNGDLIEFNDSVWEFLIIAIDDELDPAPRQTNLDEVAFRFGINPHKRSTNLTLIKSGLEINLGDESHYSLLAHLVRSQSEQEDDSIWLNNQKVRRELGLSEAQMNLQIFNARKQIEEALPNVAGHSKLKERKRRELKVNIKNFEIYKEI